MNKVQSLPLHRSTCNKLAGAFMLFAFPVLGMAMPTVTGNMVSWPDDGWYQVQRSDTYETVCEGRVAAAASVSGGPCIIDSTSYIVINHSNGDRFENISTNNAPGSDNGNSGNTVWVERNLISWPNDGWYQVQNAETYSEVCAGETSCTVQPGRYLVINHTTGERFNDIIVGLATETDDGNNNDRPLTVDISGNTIRWPDNGWYQVQDGESYASVCDGGSECTVSPGTYVLINHTSGTRQTLAVPADATSAAETGQDLIQVNFAVTVPPYMSSALQVGLKWGEQNFSAEWVEGEFWLALNDFPVDTEHFLTITFSDRHGDITLGSYEQALRTGLTEADTYTIAADQFDTGQWDSDNDGISNLDELIAGTDPLDPNAVNPSESAPDLIAVSEDLFRGMQASQVDGLAGVVDEVAFFVTQQTKRVWPDSDYYQVQLSESFINVCEGGTECALVPGSYNVINHTSGERTSLEIPYVDTTANPNATLLTAVPFNDYGELYFYDYPTIEWGIDTLNIERASYNCENGGSMIRESGAGSILFDNGRSAGGIQRHGYLFNQCRITIRGGSLLPDGNYQINGSLRELYQNHPNPQSHKTYEDFSLLGDNGLEYHVSGQTKVLRAEFRSSASATVDEFRKKLPGSQRWESITNLRTNNDADVLNFRVDVEGTFSNATTAFQPVSISTISPVTRTLYNNFTLKTPMQGSIQMLAENGHSLTVRANQTYDIARRWERYFDLDYTTATGEQIRNNAVIVALPVFPDIVRGHSSCVVERRTSPNSLSCNSYLGPRNGESNLP